MKLHFRDIPGFVLFDDNRSIHLFKTNGSTIIGYVIGYSGENDEVVDSLFIEQLDFKLRQTGDIINLEGKYILEFHICGTLEENSTKEFIKLIEGETKYV